MVCACSGTSGEMQLINTDGMAFVGPGSEWFWTARYLRYIDVDARDSTPQLLRKARVGD